MPLDNSYVRFKNDLKVLLALSKGERTFTELVEETDLPKPIINRKLKKLKEKNLVENRRGEEDKRKSYYYMTHRGLSRIKKFEERLSKEIDCLMRI
ncbi:MAG: DNA-binding transcriptional regulator HxlR family [Candidatus Methanohalarchaeum thermophilum]|uniref:DNA-binding transcriptional regulator HxlR family n=1 Tax=Methanohalarchaeum thermophilum TaxID=1903181 RepID=A0A1Q6DTR4_METT1|nr:MAG: DNA-binding transcriptional regulator HxlR family [Candidatus Methanohalarchaeum thermophilum]